MDADGDVMSVAEFCRRNGVSEPTLKLLIKRGEGPRIMRVGLRKRRITRQAEAEWRVQREQTARCR